ncbi:MAG: diacylglycerol kinase family lipid kinase [Candidatus Marinimicrobia bacterium]|nr:diacylglycerol kinase family lipid kinase [Candidatus Neomarinimicrobiota bacterium]
MTIQLIYNPNAGGGRGAKLSTIIIDLLRSKGHQVVEYRTLYRNHATEIAKHLDLNSCDALVCAGGDGTLYEVLNGIMLNSSTETRPPFGLIPVGTGNSFAQDLGMRHWRDGISAILEGKTRQVDLMEFRTEGEAYHSISSIGFGLPTDVCVRGNKYKKIAGKSAYTVSALVEILRFKPFHTKLVADGELHEFEGALVNFSNSRIFGGNMKISPDSLIDDGLIEAVVLENCTRSEILKAFPTIYSGEHLKNPHVKVYQGKHFKVETFPEKICNPEGEIFGVTPLEIDVMPKEVEFFVIDA